MSNGKIVALGIFILSFGGLVLSVALLNATSPKLESFSDVSPATFIVCCVSLFFSAKKVVQG